MSVLNHSGEEQAECPLCMEPLEVDDLNFYPCTCGYQICRFCWNRIREGENGLCPACRKAYPENPADFTPLSQEQVAAIKTEKKAREQRRRNKTLESRRQLANVRVVQKNLVFVVGLPVRLADPEILKRQEYFGKYGKIHKVVINQSTTYAGSQGPSASAYVTYLSQADALRAIQSVNNVTIDGRVLKGSLGTTKYCANFMKNQTCPKTDCMYLHELGDSSASFTKDQMHQGLHQIYERKLHNQLLAQTQKEQSLAQQQEKTIANSSGTSTNCEKHSSKEGNQPGFIPTTIVTSSNINIVNSHTKSKKDQSMSSLSSGGSKEAWPSLGSSPPNSDSSGSKQASPKPQEASPSNGHAHTHSAALSQENSTPESPSPTQQSQSKHKEGKRSRDQQSTNSNSSKTSNGTANGGSNKNEQKKWKKGISINDGSDDDAKQIQQIQERTPFENREREYDLDQLESDHHGLLDNHDLLDGSDHSLLDDDSHNLLNDTNSDALMMQRHREMLASLVDNNHLMGQQMKAPLVDSFGLLDGYDRPLMEQKELLLRERNRSEMLMRQNEMMARHHNLMQPKHYLHSSSAHNIGLESANDLLGANYPNTSMLPPFGVRLDGTVPNNVHNYGILHNNRPLLAAAAGAPPHHLALKLNGYAEPQEGRYLGENMDKFFTDFHKAQQLKYLLTKGVEGASLGGGAGGGAGAQVPAGPSAPHAAYADSRQQQSKFGHYAPPHNMMSAHQLEMEHKQRHQDLSAGMGGGAPNVGGVSSMGVLSGVSATKRSVPVDDDLDFDPFKETQKAFAEMMETELQQNGLSPSESAERIRRSRLPPPGFSAMNAFGLGAGGAGGVGAGGAGLMQRAPPPLQHAQPQQTQQDWTQMDPAIMSTSVNFPHKPSVTSPPQELFQRFSQLTLPPPPSNYSKLLQLQQQRILNGQTLQNGQYLSQHKLGGWSPAFPAGEQPYSSIPLPPGFSDLAAAPTGAEIESK